MKEKLKPEVDSTTCTEPSRSVSVVGLVPYWNESENSAGHIGKGDFGRIYRLCFYLDNLISRISKATGKTKQEMKRAADRIRKKIHNLIKEIHGKTACFLVNNFDVILLPTFETKQMLRRDSARVTGKSGRKLQKKSVKAK